MKFKHVFAFVVVLALLSVSAMPARSQMGGAKFYVTIEGVRQGKFKGEGVSAAFRDKIPGYRFSYEVTLPGNPATGQFSGRRQHSPVVITKELDSATPQIFQALITNEALRTVLIEFVRPGPRGIEEVYQTIRLTNASVAAIREHINQPRAGEVGDNRALEDVSFTFHKIEIESKVGKTVAMDDLAR